MQGAPCTTIGCCNVLSKRDGKYCTTCRTKRSRLARPLMYAYQNLKDNAKRRGIYFNVSIEYFAVFCARTAYLELKGQGADDLTIDRNIPELGYVDGNLQVLPRKDNSAKQHVDYKLIEERTYKLLEELKQEHNSVSVGEDPPF